MNIFCKNRINITFSEKQDISLDPKKFSPKTNYSFISHAHTDHLPTSRRKLTYLPKVICSKATARLFYERMGYHIKQLNSYENEYFSIKTSPGGHTFDSTVAEITDKQSGKLIIYTGDINVENRAYLSGFKPKKCDILILEATWGDRNYRFPSFKEQIEKARNYIQTELDKGYPVAVLGYPLGKSQLLNFTLGDLCDIKYSYKSIWKMEYIHRELGLNLHETTKLPDLEKNSINNDSPFLLFFTHSTARNPILNKLRKNTNLKVVGFSGWAKNSSYSYRMGTDAAFTISDHSDYQSLLEIVKKSDPEKIYTVFGDAERFARDLQKDGFNATPLKEGQTSLSNFF